MEEISDESENRKKVAVGRGKQKQHCSVCCAVLLFPVHITHVEYQIHRPLPSDIKGCLATAVSFPNMLSQCYEATSQINFDIGEVSLRSL